MGAQPFVGELQMFGGNFAPQGWALCDGQLLAIADNDALFSLLGTTYGGDGRTTFGLPDLRGRVPVGPGQGPGLSARALGSRFGAEQAYISPAQVPAHTHAWEATTGAATTTDPVGARLAAGQVYSSDQPDTALAGGSVSPSVGGQQPHNNEQPFLVINFIIALYGVYPSRS